MTQWLKQSTAVTIPFGPFVDSADGDTEEESLTIAQADIRLSKNGGAFAQTNNAAGATHMENGQYGVPLDTTDTGTLGRLRVAVHEGGALWVWQDFMVVPANVWDSMFGADALQVDVIQEIGVALDGAGSVIPHRGILRRGTAQSASATGVVLDASAAFADDVLIGATILVFGSTQGYWQARVITDNTLSTDAVVVDTWTVTPSGTITFIIIGTPPGSSTTPAPVNVVQLGGDTQSATDLKDFADAGYDPSTNKVQGVVLTDTLTTYTGNTPQTGDSFARIGAAGAGLTAVDDAVIAAIAAIDTLIDAIKAQTDQMVFGATNALNVNVTHVNEVGPLIGDGDGTPIGAP